MGMRLAPKQNQDDRVPYPLLGEGVPGKTRIFGRPDREQGGDEYQVLTRRETLLPQARPSASPSPR